MQRVFFLSVFFMLASVCMRAQTQSIDSAKITLVKISLTDGTKLWGILLYETDSTLSMRDFSTGILVLKKSKITDTEKTNTDSELLIETENGSMFFGKIKGAGEDVLLLESSIAGTIEIKTSSIAKIFPVENYVSKRGGAWFVNPNATRYLFAPSAIPLRKREGYYQNAYLLTNSVNVGLTNSVTVGGGVVIPFLFYVTPKVSFKLANNFYAGAGVLFTQSFISDMDLSAGIGYALVTVGNLEHNFTIGSGYGFAKFNKEYKSTPMPIVTLNGMARVGKKISLITENWLMPRAGYNEERDTTLPTGEIVYESVYVNHNFYSYAASLGMRIMPGSKASIDFAVVSLKGNENSNWMVLPYLDFVYKFE